MTGVNKFKTAYRVRVVFRDGSYTKNRYFKTRGGAEKFILAQLDNARVYRIDLYSRLWLANDYGNVGTVGGGFGNRQLLKNIVQCLRSEALAVRFSIPTAEWQTPHFIVDLIIHSWYKLNKQTDDFPSASEVAQWFQFDEKQVENAILTEYGRKRLSILPTTDGYQICPNR
jgi:hypothetical protein